MIVEAPGRIGAGLYDIGYLGAFSYINGGTLGYNPCNNVLIDAQSIGRFSQIGPRVTVGLSGHSTAAISPHLLFNYSGKSLSYYDYMNVGRDKEWETRIAKLIKSTYVKKIPIIGNDVWIGANATILNGVEIGDGAVVGSGALVNKDVKPYSIVGGVPAREIRRKYSDSQINDLQRLKWWRYGPDILYGLELTDIDLCIEGIERRIEEGFPLFEGDFLEFNLD